MSVENQQNKVNYVSSGSTTYPIPFYFESDEHIKLYFNDTLQVSGYTVSGEDEEAGGELVLTGAAPEDGTIISIFRDIPLTQPNTFPENGPFLASTLEGMFDRAIYGLQQLSERISRTIRLPLTNTVVDPQMTGTPVPNALLKLNSDGTGLEYGPDAAAYESDLNQKVLDAQSAQQGAETAQGNAEAAQGAAEVAQGLAETAKSDTEALKSDTQALRNEAEGFRDACELALNSVGWQDTIPLNSNTTLDASHNGCMLLVDCSSGNITLTLPPISTLDLDFAFSIGIKKSDSSGNSVTVQRSNTDKIDGANTKTIGTSGSGAVFIPDSDPSPNLWTSAEFGATAGNMTVDTFSGNGSQTAFTLSVSPGSKNNTDVYIHGVYQDKASYSLSGTTLTFSEAPVSGTNNIEVVSGTTLSSGTPSDGTVTLSKLAADVLAALIPIGTPIWNIDSAAIPGFVSAMNKTLGSTGADYSGSTYYNLYAKVWAMAGLSTTVGEPFRIASAKGATALADWNAGKLITLDFETNEIFIRAKGSARTVGSYQADDLKAHNHSLPNSTTAWSGGGGGANNIYGGASLGFTWPTGTTGGTETRPKNTGLYAFIKY